MDWDCIDSLASDAIQAVSCNNTGHALALLGEIKGIATTLMTHASVWDLVQADYEAGQKPRKITQKYKAYGITSAQVYNKAYQQQWVSPLKLKKAYEPSKSKKSNVFYPSCRECERSFESSSGRAIICPTCKAMKADPDPRRRLI